MGNLHLVPNAGLVASRVAMEHNNGQFDGVRGEKRDLAKSLSLEPTFTCAWIVTLEGVYRLFTLPSMSDKISMLLPLLL